MTDHVILIRQSSAMRTISEAEAVAALPEDLQRLERKHFHLDMSVFADAVEQGDWGDHDHYLREQASTIRSEAAKHESASIHYLGLAEVPHILALGAHLGREYAIQAHDFDSQANRWQFPSSSASINIVVEGDQSLAATITAAGSAIIRVSISARIADLDVREAVGDDVLADVTLTHAPPTEPTVGLIRSQADVDRVRLEFRRLFARVRNTRPNLDTIHLFIAAPPSICLAIGQELSLHNSPAIQTYRYRKAPAQGSQQPAILLQSAVDQTVLVPLTDLDLHTAASVRKIWGDALQDVENYVSNKSADGTPNTGRTWYSQLQPRQALQDAAPFPDLPPATKIVPSGVTVDPQPFSGDYEFEPHGKCWRLSDRLLVGLRRAVNGDESKVRQLIRLFLFHEYVHKFHSITMYSAEEVGKFANCLEHIDYTADVYALLHQLDLMRLRDATLIEPVESLRRFFVEQVELIIRSFWAFDTDLGSEWQIRRLRRYLNWYWRFVQVENAEDELALMHLFNHPPKVEIGGLSMFARQRRVLARLDRLDNTTHLELGIVLENEKLFRVSPSPNVNLHELLASLRAGKHEEIVRFFRSVYDSASQVGGVQVNHNLRRMVNQ